MDVSTRHMTWWRSARWIRIEDGLTLRTASGRRRTWRAATRAVEERQKGRKRRERERQKARSACKRKYSNCNNRSSSSNHSNALAVIGMRKPIFEETTAGAFKLKELVIEGELFFFAIT